LAAGDPRGWTATEIATTLDLALDVRDVQRNLEGLVARAQLTRHGIGREALYSLPPRADRPDARAPAGVPPREAPGGATMRHGARRTRVVGRADGATDPPLTLEYATVRTAYEAVRRASARRPGRVRARAPAWRQRCAPWWRSPRPCGSMSTPSSAATVNPSGVGTTGPGRRARGMTPPTHRPPRRTPPPRRAREGNWVRAPAQPGARDADERSTLPAVSSSRRTGGGAAVR